MSTKVVNKIMDEGKSIKSAEKPAEPQCQFFVQRKKRLCRMTVKPGKKYCGEHEPAPLVAGEQDLRVPCPLDPKHTCYASKLEKHVRICNARRDAQPEYYEHNVNAPAPAAADLQPRLPLAKVPRDQLKTVIDKVNRLYESVVEHEISTFPEQDIHPVVQAEFSEASRTETSRRHLRQASALLQLCESEGLVQDDTCYVELGAGKGHLSYYAYQAWCSRQPASRALLLDRAALRHKRDNKLRTATHGGPPAASEESVSRLRADLAHVALQRVAHVARCARAVGLAKHLCGVATDYALRCMTAAGVRHKTRGVVVATCCHHRCERAAYLGTEDLQELGVSGEELDVMLGVVSWATCGDGRSRARRAAGDPAGDPTAGDPTAGDPTAGDPTAGGDGPAAPSDDDEAKMTHAEREEVGRRAKALLDWGRVSALRRYGLSARLARFVSARVSPENIAIVGKQL